MSLVTQVEAPQDTAARLFMDHKGYPDARPFEVDKLEDQLCWYFYYELPEGVLELEVWWNERVQDWVCTVTSFVAS